MKYSIYKTSVCSITIINLLDKINEVLMYVMSGVCFLDLVKCFDAVDHKIMSLELEIHGVVLGSQDISEHLNPYL